MGRSLCGFCSRNRIVVKSSRKWTMKTEASLARSTWRLDDLHQMVFLQQKKVITQILQSGRHLIDIYLVVRVRRIVVPGGCPVTIGCLPRQQCVAFDLNFGGIAEWHSQEISVKVLYQLVWVGWVAHPFGRS